MISNGLSSADRAFSPRLRRYLEKSWPQRWEAARFHARRLFQGLPRLVRLPFGALWLEWPDSLSPAITGGTFESRELRFVERFVQPGMTVLDVGSHHGLYTLLASRRVGASGRVLTFEPSPRERRKLRLHLALNLAGNARLEPLALGSENGEADFHQVNGVETGCNSLRPPAVLDPVRRLRVSVARLDDVLQRKGIERVDFIKLDVEGAELAVLEGAEKLLQQPPRPVMLIEVFAARTAPWGYAPREIIAHLARRGFHWFALGDAGQLRPVETGRHTYDDNFVAVPLERLAHVQAWHGLVERAGCR